MNKHSATKRRSAKPSRSTATRKAPPRGAAARTAARKPAPTNGRKIAAASVMQPASEISVGQASVGRMNIGRTNGGRTNSGHVRGGSEADVRRPGVSAVAAIGSALRAHKFRVGQTVFYTSSPISRPGASGSYKVVRLLPSDGDDYQYRIKHAGEAFERVAKESQLELEG